MFNIFNSKKKKKINETEIIVMIWIICLHTII